MAKSDLLIQMVKAALTSDRESLEKSVQAVIADERNKQHHSVADRLSVALRTTPNFRRLPPPADNPRLGGPSIDSQDGRNFLGEHTPRRRLSDLFLPQTCREQCQEVIEEHGRADLLRAHGLEPRNRILLAGPPGNGKTTLAEALAYEIGITYFVVRYETIIGSFLGETSTRLKRVFDYAKTRPCILFFDEFDTLGKERGDTHETGEIKRVVSSLLLQIDDLPSYTIVISATNHPELLDRAVWRRFQIRIELPKPNKSQSASFISSFFTRFPEYNTELTSRIADKLIGLSYSELEEFCLNIQRKHILALGNLSLKDIVAEQLRLWSRQYSLPQKGKKQDPTK